MSGLARILAGHEEPGVYQWHAQFHEPDVRHTVEHAGWKFGYVDGWLHQDKGALLADLGEALAFPDHYGENFDAVVDCLRGVKERTVLLWDGWGTLARDDRRSFDTAVEIFSERCADGQEPFVVLLRGEGPEVSIPSLDT